MALPLILGAGSIIGGLFSARAARKGAETQSEAMLTASRESNAQQREQFDKTFNYQTQQADQFRADMAPYREAGVNALASLEGLVADPMSVRQLPGYQFQLDEGNRALERSAPGMTLSSPVQKAMMRYNQGIADQSYGNQYNRLAALAGTGQAATGSVGANAAGVGSQLGALGANMANQIGANTMGAATGAAQARAAGMMGQSNAFNGTLNALSGIAGAGAAGLFGENPFSFKFGGQSSPGMSFGERVVGPTATGTNIARAGVASSPFPMARPA